MFQGVLFLERTHCTTRPLAWMSSFGTSGRTARGYFFGCGRKGLARLGGCVRSGGGAKTFAMFKVHLIQRVRVGNLGPEAFEGGRWLERVWEGVVRATFREEPVGLGRRWMRQRWLLWAQMPR